MRRLLGIGSVLLLACGGSGGDGAANDTTGAATSGGSDSASEAGPSSSGAGATGDGGGDGNGDGGDSTTASTTTAGATSGADGTGAGTGSPGDPALPPAGAGLDYQLGGAYDPPAGVEVLSRDRNDSPAAGLYNICYVNGYQTQEDEEQWWLDMHPDLLLRDDNGQPFIDPDWNEILLDITTSANRDALAEIVGGWIEQCSTDGFDAVEIDNLDTYSRSAGKISQDDAVAYMALLSVQAHGVGLAIAQKNSTEIAPRQPEMGTDFAVAEECNRWTECQDYKDVYGDLVFVIEYRAQDLATGCADFPELSTVLRDLDLVTPADPGYVYDAC